MASELEEVVFFMLETEIPLHVTVVRVFSRVEARLLATYGPESGRRANAAFHGAFEAAGKAMIVNESKYTPLN